MRARAPRAALLFALLLGVGALAGWVVAHLAEAWFLDNLDRPAVEFFARRHSSGTNAVFRAVTTMGAGWFVTAGVIVAALVSWWATRSSRWPFFFLTVGAAQMAGHNALKALLRRPRPDLDPVIEIGGHAFPSGHATTSAGLFLAIALYVGTVAVRRRSLVWGVATLLAASVALSRVYLGVHWPTDVVAGLGLGAGIVAIAVRLFELPGGRNEAPEGTVEE